MPIADRRYIQLMLSVWAIIYGWSLLRTLPAELQRGTSWGILAFGIALLALTAAVVTAIFVGIPARIIMNLVLRDRGRSHRSETTVLSVLLVLCIAYAFEVRRERLSLAPPPGVATLSEFADAMPPPQRLFLVHNDGRDYISWTGELSGPFDIVSGPSCYIFNENGELVDWQAETGDGGPVEDFLESSAESRQLTLEGALSMTGTAVDHDDE